MELGFGAKGSVKESGLQKQKSSTNADQTIEGITYYISIN